MLDVTLLNNVNKSDNDDTPIVSFATMRNNKKLELWSGHHECEKEETQIEISY